MSERCLFHVTLVLPSCLSAKYRLRRLAPLTACSATGLAPPLAAADVTDGLTSARSSQNCSGEMQSAATAPLHLVQWMGITMVDGWMGNGYVYVYGWMGVQWMGITV